MIFRDNGVGLPRHLDVRRPSSLGLTIVNALVGQLSGAIDLGRNIGTEISITFPVKAIQTRLMTDKVQLLIVDR